MKHKVPIVSAAVALAVAVAMTFMALGSGLNPGGVTTPMTRAAYATTAGCGKAPTLTSGAHTIQSSGQTRNYILRVPNNYDSNHPYRLIFGLHWLGGTANDVDSGGTDGYNWSYYGLRRLADAANNGTIFVAPQGLNNGWANSGGQDVTFIDDVRNQIEAGLCVDTSQVFSAGFSYGAAMSYALACARPNIFRAVAVYSGANLSGCDGGTQPVAYIGLHGIRDNVLPIADGRALRDQFVRNNGCTPQNPPEPAYGSLTHIVTAYSGCKAGYPVVWAAFDGAGHDPGPIDGCTCDGWRTWTSGVVWNFITQFQGSSTPTPTPTPTITPTPTPTPTVTPTTGSGNCRVTDAINAWNNGLTSSITITNTGSASIDNGWSLVFDLPSGQTITNGWNATYSPNSGRVTATNVSYNASIASNASVTIGFQATHNGNTAAPSSFTLNGMTCSTS
jgi:poly(3-hydroxybutyrate) depolymerase